MVRPLRIEYAGALYHITARGNRRQNIYYDDQDRQEFLDILEKTIERNFWLCHTYCLMSNHYHLIIKLSDPTLSRGMRYLNGVYSQYLNRKYKRVGHVFQGRFKGLLVEKGSYLLELSRYVVLNPVRAKMVSGAGDWPWSSYRATVGITPPNDWLTVDWILRGFGENRLDATRAYQRFVSQGKVRASIWGEVKNQIYLGSDQFIEDMQCLIDPEQSLDNVPKLQKGLVKKPLSEYVRNSANRNEAMAVAYRSGCYTLKEIGEYFNVSPTTVGRAVKLYEDVQCEN
jgi:putative transposase